MRVLAVYTRGVQVFIPQDEPFPGLYKARDALQRVDIAPPELLGHAAQQLSARSAGWHGHLNIVKALGLDVQRLLPIPARVNAHSERACEGCGRVRSDA